VEDSTDKINSRIKRLRSQNKFIFVDEAMSDDKNAGLSVKLSSDSCKVIKDILKDDLLDDSYHLYTSRFIGLVRGKTMINFEMNYLRRRKSEYTIELSESEIEGILKPLDGVDLINPALYNYSIFDLLLKNDDARLDTILHPEEEQTSQLISFMNSYNIERFKDIPGERERTIIEGRVSESDNVGIALTKKLTTIYPSETLTGIMSNDEYSVLDRYIAIISAITSMDSPESISLNEGAIQAIDTISSELVDLANRNDCQLSFAQLLVNNGIIIRDISDYKNKEAFEYIVDRKAFRLGADNLSLITEEQAIVIINELGESSLSESQVDDIVDSSKIAKNIKVCLILRLNVIVGRISKREIAEKIQAFMKKSSTKIEKDIFDVLANAFDAAGVVGLLLDSNLKAHEMVNVLSGMHVYAKFAKPLSRVELDNNILNRLLVDKLDCVGIVSSWKLIKYNKSIQANMSRKSFSTIDNEEGSEIIKDVE
jgi:hypothetical protein